MPFNTQLLFTAKQLFVSSKS